MSDLMVYEAIRAKVKTGKSVFLTKKEWEQLLGYETIDEVAGFLEMKYKKRTDFVRKDVREIHREDLEVLLQRYVVSELEKMVYYFSASYKQFFKVLLTKYELYDLQLLLRRLMYKQNKVLKVESHFIHSRQFSKLSYEKLIEAEQIESLLEGLKGTDYDELIRNMAREDLSTRAFHMEMKLSMAYYKRVMDAAKKLDEKDYVVVKKILGKKIDLLNMQWLYRGIKYYDLSREEMLIYCLQEGNLRYRQLKALAYSQSISDFKQLANKLFGQSLFLPDEGDYYMVKKIDTALYQQVKKVNENESIGFIFKYLIGLEIQLDDLVAVIEGVRYQLPKEVIRNYLVYVNAG